MIQKLLLAFLTAFLFWGCETRLPTEEIDFEQGLRAELYVSGDAVVEVDMDTLTLMVELLDTNNNVVALESVDTSYMIANVGRIQEDKYYYKSPSDSIMMDSLVDTINLFVVYNDGLDTAKDELEVLVTPSESSIGFLPPDKISVSVRTDTVYMKGAWQMFIDAIVSDSLGNPVKDGTPVFFKIESSTVDTSLVVIRNIAETGDTANIDDVYDRVPGDAINVLTYKSEAIGATIVVKAMVQNDSSIVDYDTLILPVPTSNMKLVLSDRNGGVVEVPHNSEAIAKFEVFLRDGFNKPIPYHYVNAGALAGRIMPNAKVFNEDSSEVIGSMPVEGDTIIDSIVFDHEEIQIDTFYDTTLASMWPYDTTITQRIEYDTLVIVDSTLYDTTTYELLDNPYSGYTDSSGAFPLWIKMSSNEAPLDSKINTLQVQVELEEATTHYKVTDFSFPVLFNKY